MNHGFTDHFSHFFSLLVRRFFSLFSDVFQMTIFQYALKSLFLASFLLSERSIDVAEEAEHAEDRDGVLLEAVGCRRYAVVSSLHHQ